MIEAIAKIAEAAQEMSVSIEECKVPISVIEDMTNLISEIGEVFSESQGISNLETIDEVYDGVGYQDIIL